MATFETFVLAVYVMIDRFVRTQLPPDPVQRGRKPALGRSAVLTLGLISQLQRFSSERDCMRCADTRLRSLFPTLPDRSQVNRAIRRQQPALEAFGQWCANQLDRVQAPWELLDSTAKPLRNRQRRGEGALQELTACGRSLRLDYFLGIRVLVATTPDGVITGTAIAPGNTNDHPLAEVLFAARAAPDAAAAWGTASSGTYLADTGFAGRRWRAHWGEVYGVDVVAPPQPDSDERWPEERKQAHIGRRQPIESVIGRLLYDFRLERDRPKTIGGVLSRLAAKVSVHNFLIWLNRREGRPDFAIAGVIGW
jgi:Transposase DDE domain